MGTSPSGYIQVPPLDQDTFGKFSVFRMLSEISWQSKNSLKVLKTHFEDLQIFPRKFSAGFRTTDGHMFKKSLGNLCEITFVRFMEELQVE